VEVSSLNRNGLPEPVVTALCRTGGQDRRPGSTQRRACWGGATTRIEREPHMSQSADIVTETDIEAAAAPEAEAAPGGLRVVVAEDEALIRLDLVEMLREEGYDVVGEAGDGEEAVRLARELRPNLIMMDIKMPGTDGLEAARTIAGERLAPVVMLTAFSQRELVESARDAGAMAYLVKPFSKTDVVPAIELAASRYAEVAALEAEVAGLTDRLETRKAVERAKGLLMAKKKMTEPDAFRWIQRTAMDRRTTMRAVADAVVETFG